MTINTFSVPYGNVLLKGDKMEGDTCKEMVLCLHGGGTSGRSVFTSLRELLGNEGVCSLSFDQKGHGDTQGNLYESSLHDKVLQACAVIKQECGDSPCNIIASSMGGYVAIKMTEIYPVATLILIAPAAYTQEAYDISFGPLFSQAIRRPLSWQESDAFSVLSAFKGNLIIFKAELDQVIPRGLVEMLYESATSAHARKVITVPKATHSLLAWLASHPEDMTKTVAEIIRNLL